MVLSDFAVPSDLSTTGVPGPLRVATFNCHCLIDQPALRAQGIARGLAALDVDAVALQELCETPGQTDNLGAAVARELSSVTGVPWEHRYARTHLAWDQWNEGVGLVARKASIVASGEEALPQGAGPFPRKVVWARVATPRGTLALYSVHLIAGDNLWSVRVDQVNAVLAVVRRDAQPGVVAVVAGDFNDKDWTGPLQAMRAGPPAFTDAWATAHPGSPGNTFDNPTPSGRIDYVMIESAKIGSIARAEVIFDQQYQGVWLSDHRGVFAEFTTR